MSAHDWYVAAAYTAAAIGLAGLIALTRALDDPGRSARAAAIVTLVGFVNIPIIKFSVDWWNTLHQPASVLRAGGPTIDASMLWPLLAMALGPQLLGHTAYNWSLRYVSATFVAVVTLGEPVGSALLAFLIFGEGFAPLQFVGFSLLLVGIYLAAKGERS